MASPRRRPPRRGLSDQIRSAIASQGHTAYSLGKTAGVDAGVISRFLSGERDIRLETADRLADALGLRIVEGARSRGRRPTAAPLPSPTE